MNFKTILISALSFVSVPAFAYREVFFDDFQRRDSTTIGYDYLETGDVVLADGIVRARNDGLSTLTLRNLDLYNASVQASIDNIADPNGRRNTYVELVSRLNRSGQSYNARYGRDSRGTPVAQISYCDRYNCQVLAQRAVYDQRAVITFIANGNELALFVNGRRALFATDTRLYSGSVGLRFIGFYGPVVDNFRVADLDN